MPKGRGAGSAANTSGRSASSWCRAAWPSAGTVSANRAVDDHSLSPGSRRPIAKLHVPPISGRPNVRKKAIQGIRTSSDQPGGPPAAARSVADSIQNLPGAAAEATSSPSSRASTTLSAVTRIE